MATSTSSKRKQKKSKAKKTEVVYGKTEPRIFTPPLRKLTPKTSLGFLFIEFARDVAKKPLFPWQEWLAIHALELKPDGTPRFRTVVLLVARQNGKSTFLQLLSLFVMYVLGRKLVIGTAQNLDAAEEVWQGAIDIAEESDQLDPLIDKVVRVNGKKTLKLKTKERYKLATANRKGGRSLTGDHINLDELREHQNFDAWGALTKTTMARKNAQIWAVSNAGDRTSVVLLHLRRITHSALGDPDNILGDSNIKAAELSKTTIGMFEYSAEPGCDLHDLEGIAQANPSLNHGELTLDAVYAAIESDPEPVVRTEVLCQWVDTLSDSPDELNLTTWLQCEEEDRHLEGTVTVGLDVAPWSASASIVAVGEGNGRPVIELIERKSRTQWVIPKLLKMEAQHAHFAVALDPRGPVGSMIPDLEQAGLEVIELSPQDSARSLQAFSRAVVNQEVTHRGQSDFNTAMAGVILKRSGDSLRASRVDSSVDITPLMAAAAAWWIATTVEPEEEYDVLESAY